MKIQTVFCLLFCFVNAGFCEGTNGTHDLFGITVTQKVSEAETQFELGSSHYGEQDYTNAVACFKKAAELGHARARFNLGLCFMNGTGVAPDNQAAALWFGKAADQGLKEAFYPLGICHYNLEQYAEAYAWALYAESIGDARLKQMLDSVYSEEEMTAGKARFEALKKARRKAKKESE